MTQPNPESQNNPGGIEDLRNRSQQPPEPAAKPEADSPPETKPPADPVKGLQEELERTRKALKDANRDAMRNRLKAKGEDDEEGDADKVEAKYRKEMNDRDAADLLRDARLLGKDGLATSREARQVVKLLASTDPQAVVDAIDELRESYPHLFASDDDEDLTPSRRRGPRPGPAGGEPNRPVRPKSNLTPTSQALLKQAGFRAW